MFEPMLTESEIVNRFMILALTLTYFAFISLLVGIFGIFRKK